MAKIDEGLNLVVPVERDGTTAYIHATPIGRATFEAHFRLIAATHADLFGRGGAYANVAPRIAALTLRDVGRKEARANGDVDEDGNPKGDSGASSLLAEVKRLCVVAHAGPNGWDLLPVDAAIARGALDDSQWREAESAIVFFTCLSWMTPGRDAPRAVQVMSSAIGLSTTASPPSEWTSSLPRSTPAEGSTQAPQAEAQKPTPQPAAPQRTVKVEIGR